MLHRAETVDIQARHPVLEYTKLATRRGFFARQGDGDDDDSDDGFDDGDDSADTTDDTGDDDAGDDSFDDGSDDGTDDDMDDATRADMAAYTGCIAGALTEDEFRNALAAAGLTDTEIRETHRVHEHARSAIIRARKP